MRDQLGRYQVITDRTELALPACSYFNKKEDDGWWIDTDTDVDDGRIYIGRQDAEQIASLLGWKAPGTTEDKTHIKDLQEENDALRALLIDLRMLAADILDRTSTDEESGKGAGTVITAGGVVAGLSSIQPKRRFRQVDGKDDSGVPEVI